VTFGFFVFLSSKDKPYCVKLKINCCLFKQKQSEEEDIDVTSLQGDMLTYYYCCYYLRYYFVAETFFPLVSGD